MWTTLLPIKEESVRSETHWCFSVSSVSTVEQVHQNQAQRVFTPSRCRIVSFKEVKNTLFQLYEQHRFVLLPFQRQRSFIQLHMYILVHLHYKMSKYFAYLIWNDLFSPIFETSMFKVYPLPSRVLRSLVVDYIPYIDSYKRWLEFRPFSIWSVFYWYIGIKPWFRSNWADFSGNSLVFMVSTAEPTRSTL